MSVETADKAQAKRDAEKARREEIKNVKVMFADREAELPEKLDADQRQRALNAPAGMRGDRFRTFVLTGKAGSEQDAEAKAARESNERVGRKARAAKDPEAAELAARAKESAPGIKSRFRPLEGRQLLDRFAIEQAGSTVRIARTDVDSVAAQISKKSLVAFRDGEDFEGKAEVRSLITALGKDTRLWGRKFAAFVLARIEA